MKNEKKYFIAVAILIISTVIGALNFSAGKKTDGNASEIADSGNIVGNETVVPQTEVFVVSNQQNSELFPNLPPRVLLDVPFTPQAPTGRWGDIRQGNGCEEASLLMAVQWANDVRLTPPTAEKEIIAMSDFSLKHFGHFHDESNEDTLKLLKEYLGYENAHIREDIGREEMRFELSRGNLVIVPVNAVKLGNPYYHLPFPGNHKLVVIGYDDDSQMFITNDPGTSRGTGFRYKYDKLENALMDYPTGYHVSFETLRTSMIVVEK